MLLLAEVGNRPRGGLNGQIERVQRFEELVPIKRLTHEGGNDFFHLAGNDIALREVLIVKDRADEALGEQMLDEHFVHRRHTQVGI